ncbi:MAG: ribonuclease III [Lachnospiraceae bacterium]|nr:ribonuclease III [Lachnospiraceae bacterium]
MEESITSISILDEIRKKFDCKAVDIRTYSPLTLAYIGDAVYDLIIRSVIVARANKQPAKLHKAVIQYVNAKTQAKMIEVLEAELTEEETAVYHRGRNAKSYTTAKNASVGDYRKATGLEALFGYLYLNDETDRLLSLICLAFDKMGITI